MPYIDDGFEALLEPFYNGKKLTDPISTVEDKNQLLPAFLKVKGMLYIWSTWWSSRYIQYANITAQSGLVKQYVFSRLKPADYYNMFCGTN